MKRLNVLQGSPEWLAHRATARNASEAPAMLGCSPYMTRSELLQMMHTGIRRETTADEEWRFADGHAIEAAQRPGAEQLIGEPLYAVTGCEVVDGIELSASFDGLTMAEDVAYECKTLNDSLRYDWDEGNGDHLPKHYRVQMEQQLMVCGGERVLFVAATKDGQEVRRCWYASDPKLRAEILAGWKQFDADLAAYQPPAPSAPVVVAAPVQALPSVVVSVSGSIAVTDNFKAFETALRDFLEHRLIREPKTDQDFADLDVQIKAMKGAEAALDATEGQMLAQLASVDAAKKTKDMLAKLVRDNRLMAEKLLASEKERRRGEIVAGGVSALKAHIDGLNQRLGKAYMPQVSADFGLAIKGLKSLASMEDKVATTLANAKIAANEIAEKIDANLRFLRDNAGEFKHLFPDAATIVLKAPDDMQALVKSRIAEHQAAEQRRAEELAERERVRIRREEQAKAEREAREKLEAEQREAAARAAASPPPPAPVAVQPLEATSVVRQEPPVVTDNVRPMPTRAPSSPPTLRLGQIGERLGFTLTADFLSSLGYEPAATDKAAKLYHEQDFPFICGALIAHIQGVQKQRRAA